MQKQNWTGGRTALYVFFLAGTACSVSPTAPAGSVTVSTAIPVSPANGAFISNTQQPITLTVTNAAIADQTTGVTYSFQVATDAGFVNQVAIKNVPQTATQTSDVLGMLQPGSAYYWRVATNSGTTVGAYSNPVKFTVGAAVTIQAPAISSPVSGSVNLPTQPTLTVTNAARTGPVGPLSYHFDVSASSTFATIVVSGNVPEGSSGTTSFALPASLSLTTNYFWRVQVNDSADGISSAFSTTGTFETGNGGPVLWSGVQPPGTPGHAVKGDNWQTQSLISFNGFAFTSPSLDMLQIFDLMDRGMDPQSAINWMQANGYPTAADYFPANNVIGFEFEYMALIDGAWDVVIRSGA